MLLDARGHLKLADFGTCIKMDKVKLKQKNLILKTTNLFIFKEWSCSI